MMHIQKDWLNSLNQKEVVPFDGSCKTCRLVDLKDPECVERRKKRKKDACEKWQISEKYIKQIKEYVAKEGRFPTDTPQKIIDMIRE